MFLSWIHVPFYFEERKTSWIPHQVRNDLAIDIPKGRLTVIPEIFYRESRPIFYKYNKK